MHKSLIILLFLIPISFIAFAQENKIIRTETQKYSTQEDQLLPSNKTFYQYDENNNEINIQGYSWDIDSIAFILTFSSTKTYSSSNKLLTEYRVRSSRYYIVTDSATYQYDQLDSLLSSTNIVSTTIIASTSPTSPSYHRKIDKFYTSGKIDSTYEYSLSPTNIWEMREKKYHIYSGNKTSIYQFYYSDSIWVANGQDILIVDTSQNYRSFWTNYSDFAQEEMRISYYDDHNNITLHQYYVKNSPTDSLELSRETIYTNTYDNAENIIETKELFHDYEHGQIWHTSRSKFKFIYYCDNILKEKQTSYNDKVSRSTTYFYQKGINCGQEQEATINIFPNPFHDYIDLTGIALEYHNVSINIYNVIGQNIFSKSLPERTDRAKVALPELPKGIYLATFQWNNQILTKKLVRN